MQNRDAAKQNMFAHIEHWRQSGISQKRYCEQNEITYHKFHYWLRQYNNCNDQQAGGFIELQIPTGQPFMEVLLTDGKRIIFNQPVSSSYLKDFIN